jgi:SNF2 family DNA or RNA helicase
LTFFIFIKMAEVEWAATLKRTRSKKPGDAIPLLGTLLPYQAAGVQWIVQGLSVANGCILADEMGLGASDAFGSQ